MTDLEGTDRAAAATATGVGEIATETIGTPTGATGIVGSEAGEGRRVRERADQATLRAAGRETIVPTRAADRAEQGGWAEVAAGAEGAWVGAVRTVPARC